MRFAPLLVGSLLLLALSGCTGGNDLPPAGSGETPEDPDRVGRGDRGIDVEEDEEAFVPIELLRTPVRMAGQGPESFDVDVVPGVQRVDYLLTQSAAHALVDVRVELTGCGSSGSAGGGATGSVGLGGGMSDKVCDAAEPGAQTFTVSGTAVVYDGTLVLIGYVAADPATADAAAA